MHPLAIAGIWYAVAAAGLVLSGPAANAGWVLAGLVFWPFLEYGSHRFVLHGRGSLARHHKAHHRLQKEHRYYAIPLQISAAIAGLIWLVVAVLAGVSAAFGFVAGLTAHYATYEALHLVTHFPPAWMRGGGLVAQHLRHHKAFDRNYGVTPAARWLDHVFRTAS